MPSDQPSESDEIIGDASADISERGLTDGAASFWRMIAHECVCPISAIDEGGQVLYANHAYAELLEAPHEQVIGSGLHNWFDHQLVDERLGVVRQVLGTGQPARAVDMLRGRRFLVTFIPSKGGESSRAAVLVHASRPPRQSDGHGVMVMKHRDPGRLAQLTPREADVLRLLTQGLSQREIAEKLKRTVKTIETHRASIGRKLGIKKNIQLALLAITSGMLDPGEIGRSAESTNND